MVFGNPQVHLLRSSARISILALLFIAGAFLLTGCDESATMEPERAGPGGGLGDRVPRVSATPPTTEAPDLVSVDNFRKGPKDDDGNRQTLVDFTFDQAAYLNGGNRSSFSLVPLDGGDPLNARGIEPDADVAEGDEIVTVLFEGKIAAKDYARGFVATGVVNSDCCNIGSANPANINQSAIVSNEGLTENPDLIQATRDGDQVLFEFDEALTDDDVVQNTSGLRIFFPETDQNSVIPDAGALSVKRQSATVLRAYYGEDLPEGYTLDDAVGAFVDQGSVQAASGSRGANDGVNAFDEFAPLGDTGAVVCAAAPETGELGDGSGPTEAPDVVSVGNFRRGPFTDGFEPTTCVDFVFDQVAYLNGGTFSNFHLVPLDGGDALDGSTNQTADSDESGDRVVTIVFPGDLSPSDFARGYVDSEVVNSNESNVSSDDPTNINQSAAVSPNTKTENPDLISIRRDGDSFLFEFDEDLTTDDVAQNSSGLRLYFPEAKQQSTIPFASSAGVDVVDARTLRAFYDTYPADYGPSDAVGGYAVQGTVQAASGSRGGNDGVNAFDELAPVSVEDASVCEPSADVGGTGDGSGPTEAPDLLTIDNFRDGPRTSQFEPTTCVDFTFDQIAYLNGGDRSNFQLVPLDASDALSGTTNVTPTQDQDPSGDNIVTVIFPGDLSPSDFARGYVDTGVLNSAESNISSDNPLNINQAANIDPNVFTENPDLVQNLQAVERQSEVWLYFEFDEALTDDDVIQSTSGLRIYFPSTTQSSTIPDAGAVEVKVVDDRTLRAKFKDLPEGYSVQDAVGAFVVQGTVQAAVGSRGGNDGKSAFDETFLNVDWPGS